MINFSEHKPSILIMTEQGKIDNQWNQVLWGIEEEGIPFQIKQANSEYSIEENAYEAAHQSALSVGIACSNNEIVIHYKNLQQQQPLFRTNSNATTKPEQLRNLGSNAARLVKGIPFKISE